jgi:hypothetical protein
MVNRGPVQAGTLEESGGGLKGVSIRPVPGFIHSYESNDIGRIIGQTPEEIV